MEQPDADSGLGLTSIESLAKLMPPGAWERAVGTACETFEKCIAPVTAITAGCARLIQAKFDSFVDIQKVYAAEGVARAREKVKKSKKPSKEMPKAPVVIRAIEESSTQTDETLRELWTNLIAQELIGGGVHPEFTRILSRLDAVDAHTLAEIAEKSPKTFNQKEFRIFVETLHRYKIPLVGLTVGELISSTKPSYTTEHLRSLNLIERSGGKWVLTVVGEEFIKAVGDPALE